MIDLPSNSESFRDNSEFFVGGIGNLVGCVLNRLFRITGELFTLAFRPLSEAFGLQLFRAGGFTGYFPSLFPRPDWRRQKLYLWCYPLSISSRLLATFKRNPTKKVPPNMIARNGFTPCAERRRFHAAWIKLPI
jgi:hypothetical protein